MALQEYAGAIVLEVDGQEVEVIDISITNQTGRKLVKTMNKSGRAQGFSKGISEFDITATVVVPLSGELDWAKIDNAKLVIYPSAKGGKRVSYTGCFTTEVGVKYSVDSEARRDLKLNALNMTEE